MKDHFIYTRSTFFHAGRNLFAGCNKNKADSAFALSNELIRLDTGQLFYMDGK
jgi:hypothetical protein